MVNSKIKLTEKIAFENGAIGFKCNGAGGGGSVIILAGAEYEPNLKKKLIKNGFTILPSKLDFQGVQTWETSA
jgi:galactokinase/mevalonate kinase-like predicted kinase